MSNEEQNQDEATPQTPLEMVRETQRIQGENLAIAREDAQMKAENREVEEERVDIHAEVPGGIGKSGVASNPRFHPQRNNG